MKINRVAWLTAAMLTVGLAGCNRETAQAPVPAATIAPPPVEVAPAPVVAKVEPLTNGILTVTPGKLSTCPGTEAVIAELSWKVAEPGVELVRIEVGRDGEERKLMVEGSPTGSIKTGPWVDAGMHFYLSDKASGKELSTLQVAAEPCVAVVQ